MRSRYQSPLYLIRSLSWLFLSLPISIATPVRSDAELADLNNATLAERWPRCHDGIPCGYYNQLCCAWNQGCYTNAQTQAECTPAPTPAPTSGGHWEYYTKTWVETNRITRTKVYSTYVGPSPVATWVPPQTTQKVAHCSWGQHSCGPICCKSWQYCIADGQCGSHRRPTSYSYTAPLRPTSHTRVVYTNTVERTTTVGFQPAVETGHHRHRPGGVVVSESTTGGGLSGGAIAGIVIGVIVAIIILIILCLILCFGAAWNAILAFFGLGKRQRRKTVIEEEYHHHGSRADGRTYYGGASGRPNRPPPPKKKKDNGWGWGTVILGLGALWACLGFRQRRERRRRDEKSDYSSDYYSDNYTNSSSDRRTRDTRRSSRR